jgi:Ca2+:H+ antiporter
MMGSSLQIVLLITPITVLVGWILGNDSMTLGFDFFPAGILLITAVMTHSTVFDGKSN